MTYKEARVYLDEMSKYGSVLGLDTIRGLLRELGDPQDDLEFIHIAGTNGKGSVLAYTSTILSEAGYRIGRYVSPTVVSYLERIQIDGRMIPRESFARLTEKVKRAIARMEAAGEPHPTVFEIETAIAFLYFQEENCDLVLVEAGLGGALDATNVIGAPICAVFTSISRDHMAVLGNTLEEIAQNKAGIIKQGCAVVSGRQQRSVEKILQKAAEKERCLFRKAEVAQILEEGPKGLRLSYKSYHGLHSPLAGRSQAENAATALEVIDVLREKGYAVPKSAVYSGMEKAVWPGRFSCILDNPLFILDGAHNADAAQKLYESVNAYFRGKRLIYIMGVFKDKEYDKISRILCPLASSVYTIDLPDEKRTLPAKVLAEEVRKYCPKVRETGTIQEAVDAALMEAGKEDVILAFGSLSYLGTVQRIIESKNLRQRGRSHD